MAESLCRIIISGTLVAGKNRQTVVRDLAALFKCSADQAAALINGQPVPLKRLFDKVAAQRYATRLLQIGVKCGIQTVGASDANQTMVCPKCHTRQPLAAECATCGIVVERRQKAPTDANQDGAAHKLEPRQKDSLVLRMAGSRNLAYYQKNFRRFEAKDDKYVLQWNLYAFLIPFAWFVYRKMPVAAAVTWILYGILPRSVLLVLHVLCGFAGNFWYFKSLRLKTDHLPSNNDRKRTKMLSGGGVSGKSVMVATGIAYVLMAIYIFSPLGPMLGLMATDVEKLNEQKVEQLQRDRAQDLAGAASTGLSLVGESISRRIYEFEAKGKSIGIPESLDKLLEYYQIEVDAMKDVWSHPVRYEKYTRGFVVTSAGPDGVFGTKDDISQEVEMRLSRPVTPPPGFRSRAGAGPDATVNDSPGTGASQTNLPATPDTERDTLVLPKTEDTATRSKSAEDARSSLRTLPLVPAE